MHIGAEKKTHRDTLLVHHMWNVWKHQMFANLNTEKHNSNLWMETTEENKKSNTQGEHFIYNHHNQHHHTHYFHRASNGKKEIHFSLSFTFSLSFSLTLPLSDPSQSAYTCISSNSSSNTTV